MEAAPALVSDAAASMSTAADAMKDAADIVVDTAETVGNMTIEGFVDGTGKLKLNNIPQDM